MWQDFFFLIHFRLCHEHDESTAGSFDSFHKTQTLSPHHTSFMKTSETILFLLLLFSISTLKELVGATPESTVETFFKKSGNHTNNWAVLVCSFIMNAISFSIE
jgi:hypothetical protein